MSAYRIFASVFQDQISLQFKAEGLKEGLKDKMTGHVSPYLILCKAKEDEDG